MPPPPSSDTGPDPNFQAAPTFTETAPVVPNRTGPGALTAVPPDGPPDLDPVVVPDAPGMVLPDFPTLLAIDLPAVPTINLPTFQRIAMNAPKGHEQNADQIAYWNGPGGQRWARRQQVQDVLLGPIADLFDRSRQTQSRRAHRRCRLRQWRHDDRVRAQGRSIRSCARRRRVGADAGAGAGERAGGRCH